MRNLPKAIRTWDTSKGTNWGDIKQRLTRLERASGERIYVSTSWTWGPIRDPAITGIIPHVFYIYSCHTIDTELKGWESGEGCLIGGQPWTRRKIRKTWLKAVNEEIEGKGRLLRAMFEVWANELNMGLKGKELERIPSVFLLRWLSGKGWCFWFSCPSWHIAVNWSREGKWRNGF